MTPYALIAEDLRRRIRSGELGPGARVPSTRELATRWGVATATAAHALRALAHEGLVRAVPRSGTVVSPAQPTSAAPRMGELSRDRVVAAAIAMADDEGLRALSIRGLAARLNVSAMALYRHVRNKQELLVSMADVVFGEEKLPRTPPRGWRAQLELAARKEWAVLKRHPWAARVVHISRPNPSPNALAFVDFILRALDASALSARGKLDLHIVLHGFVQGLAVNLEAEADAVDETGMTDQDHMRHAQTTFDALARSGRYPHFAAMMDGLRPSFDLDFDALFETGLARLLDGFAPFIEGTARRR